MNKDQLSPTLIPWTQTYIDPGKRTSFAWAGQVIHLHMRTELSCMKGSATTPLVVHLCYAMQLLFGEPSSAEQCTPESPWRESVVHKDRRAVSPESHPTQSAMFGSLSFSIFMCKMVVVILDFKTRAKTGVTVPTRIGSWCSQMQNYHYYLSRNI